MLTIPLYMSFITGLSIVLHPVSPVAKYSLVILMMDSIPYP